MYTQSPKRRTGGNPLVYGLRENVSFYEGNTPAELEVAGLLTDILVHCYPNWGSVASISLPTFSLLDIGQSAGREQIGGVFRDVLDELRIPKYLRISMHPDFEPTVRLQHMIAETLIEGVARLRRDDNFQVVIHYMDGDHLEETAEQEILELLREHVRLGGIIIQAGNRGRKIFKRTKDGYEVVQDRLSDMI